jgi:hypothetical protein
MKTTKGQLAQLTLIQPDGSLAEHHRHRPLVRDGFMLGLWVGALLGFVSGIGFTLIILKVVP